MTATLCATGAPNFIGINYSLDYDARNVLRRASQALHGHVSHR